MWQCSIQKPGLSALNLKTMYPLCGIVTVSLIGAKSTLLLSKKPARSNFITSATVADLLVILPLPITLKEWPCRWTGWPNLFLVNCSSTRISSTTEFSLIFSRCVQWQKLFPRQCSGSVAGLQKMLSSMSPVWVSKEMVGGTKEILLMTPTRVWFS